ncbi:MAG: MraY family glycosyltransferase [Bacilli bacterium]
MIDFSIKKIVLMTVCSFIISVFIMPFIMKVANHIGAIDVPKDTRRVHTKPIPRLGGLGIFIAFLFGYMFFGVQSVTMNAILIGSFIIIITGIFDDIKPIPSKVKLLMQVIAALVVMLFGHIRLQDITALGFYIDFGIFSYPLTVFFIVACINIINLIDGLDGLSGGIASIFFLTVGIISIYSGNSLILEITLAFLMLGSTLGFLVHNFYPAKIFAGDTGSMFMGYMISIIALLGFKGTTLISFFVPLLVLAIPILDTLFAIIRRLIKKQPIFEADKEHLHHQLLNITSSQRKTVLIIYSIDLLFAAASIFYFLKDPFIGKIVYILLLIIIVWLVCCTTIISKKNKETFDKIGKRFKDKVKKNKTKK